MKEASYYTNRFLTPLSIANVAGRPGIWGLYLFGIRVAMWTLH